MIAVTGSTGQVGSALLRAIPGARGVPRADLDRLADADILVHCAAITAVDWCEDHPAEARAVNVDLTRRMARAAKHLIYLSTEYVFDGRGGPYGEDDPPNPLSVYGRTKLEGEEAAREAPKWTIVRSTVIFSHAPGERNFLMQVLGGRPMRVPRDQVSNPTLASNLAEAVAEIAGRGLAGVWNVVGSDRLNRYDFAMRIAKRFGLDASKLAPVETRELGQKAPRPLEAGLRIDKARRELKTRLLGVDEALDACWRESR